MAKSKQVFVCVDCGWSAPKWQGQCRNCGAWDTLESFSPAYTNVGLTGNTPTLGASPGSLGSGDLGTESQDNFPSYSGGIFPDISYMNTEDGSGGFAQSIKEISAQASMLRPTGVSEFDRVLGGGLVPGAVILLSGEPGVGKSTLLLEVAAAIAQNKYSKACKNVENSNVVDLNAQTTSEKYAREEYETKEYTDAPVLRVVKDLPEKDQTPKSSTQETFDGQDKPSPGNELETQDNVKVLYITGEESAAQVKLRAQRIGAISDQLFLAAQSSLDNITMQVQKLRPGLLIVDSVQTMIDPKVSGATGSVTQVKAVAAGLIRLAKALHMPVLLVGHVTKDGNLAGPRVLEHLVDVVCHFEGDSHGRLRLLRAIKNRYGPTDEVGCFDLTDRGLESLTDPCGLFLSHSTLEQPGSCVTVSLEGRRAMPTEIQALVAPGGGGSGRRTTAGLDNSRVAMILAVLQARLGFDLNQMDVYASTVGGAKTMEPATDMAVALAVASAFRSRPLGRDLVAFGEVSLTAEIRPCVGLERRLCEAARLGFKRALIPAVGSSEILKRGGFDLEIFPTLHLLDAIENVMSEN